MGPEDALLANENVMPGQFWDRVRGSLSTPEKRLLFEILEDAIADWGRWPLDKLYELERATYPGFTYLGQKTSLRALDAHLWLFDDGQPGMFSFRGICESLDIDPGWLRGGLLEFRTQMTINWRHRHRAPVMRQIGVAAHLVEDNGKWKVAR